MLALAPAAAQTADKFVFKPGELTWQEYRRDDFGFRVEMPGEPNIEAQQSGMHAEVSFDVAAFGVTVRETTQGRAITSEEAAAVLDAQGKAIQASYPGIKFHLTRFTMNGCPGREDKVVGTAGTDIYRAVVCGGRYILLTVMYMPRDDTSSHGRAFPALVPGTSSRTMTVVRRRTRRAGPADRSRVLASVLAGLR